MKKENIIKAGVLGDAFGYNVEFQSWEHIRITYGGPILFSNCNNFIASDDTQMTLFCLEALKENHQFNNDNENIIKRIYDYYLEWNATQYADLIFKKEFSKQKELQKRQAPGRTCLTALGSKFCGTIEKRINESKGCGGIMRVAPIAFLNRNLDDIIYLGCAQAAITHGHPEGYLSSGFFAGLLKLGIDGKEFQESYYLIKDKIKEYKDSESFINYLDKLENNLSKNYENPNKMTEEIGEGWTGESALGLAIYAMISGKSFEDVIVISTNHSGDSDSTASLAGQLYAAYNEISKDDLILFNQVDLAEITEKSLEEIDLINNFEVNKLPLKKEIKKSFLTKLFRK